MALPRGRFEHAARAGDHSEDGGGAVDERREACRDVLLGLGLGLGFGFGFGFGFGLGLEDRASTQGADALVVVLEWRRRVHFVPGWG